MIDENTVKILINDIVSGFRRFETDALKRMTSQGVRIEDAAEILSRATYACLFETILLQRTIDGREPAGTNRKKAFSEEKIHQRVAEDIFDRVLHALKETGSRYTWRAWLVKREKKLNE